MTFFKSLATTSLFLLSLTSLSAQSTTDGFFQPKGQGNLTASYTRSVFDAFFVGDERVEGVPAHNEITQQIFSLYGTYGITDRLTVIANVPFITADGDGEADPVNGETEVSGLQDVSLALKYQLFSLAVGNSSQLRGIGGLGVGIPGGYQPNGILSLGNGAFATDLSLGGHLQTDGGFFVTGVAGYSLRGTTDDELNTVAADELDVPDALLLTGKIGYGNDKFFASAWIDHQSSLDGVDIMGEGFSGNFPETEVNYTRAGLNIYVPVTQSIGLSAYYGTVLSGRNLGDSNFVGGGVTYSFGK